MPGSLVMVGRVKEENNVYKELEDPYLRTQFLMQWKQNTVSTMWKLPVYFQLLRHLRFKKC